MSAKAKPFLVKALVGKSEDPQNDVRLYVAMFATQAEAILAVKREVPREWRVVGVYGKNGKPQTAQDGDVKRLDLRPRQVAALN